MFIINRKNFLVITLILFILLSFNVIAVASSENENTIFIQTSVITKHWDPNNNYNEDPKLINIEYYSKKNKLYGITKFQNSFYQPSWYIYKAKKYNLKNINENLKITSRITAGFVFGYDDENGKYLGLINELKNFPVILPTLGISYKKVEFNIVPLATEGFMITTGVWVF